MQEMARQLQETQGNRQADAATERLRRELSELARRQSVIGSAMEQAGFVRAVRFGSTTRFGLRWLTVAPAPAVEDALLAAALKVTATKAGSSMRRSRSRVH